MSYDTTSAFDPALHPRENNGQWTSKTGAAATVTLGDERTRNRTSTDAIEAAWGSFSGCISEPEAGGATRLRFLEEDGETRWEAVVDANGLLTDAFHKEKRINSGLSAFEDAEYELAEAHSIPLSNADIKARRELNDAIAYERATGGDIDAELNAFYQAKDYHEIDAIRLERVKEVGKEYRSILQHPLRSLAEGRKQSQMQLIELASRRRTAELRTAGIPVPHSRLPYNNPFREAVNDVELEEGIRNYDGSPATALEYATERKRELNA